MINSQRPRSFWFWETFLDKPKDHDDKEKFPALVVENLRNNLIVEFGPGFESSAEDGWDRWDLGHTVWHFYTEPVTDKETLSDIAFGNSKVSAYFRAQKEGFFEMVFIPLLRIMNSGNYAPVLEFIEKTIDNYVEILKSPVEVDILFLPIFMVSENSISMLNELNHRLFEKGYNLSASLHRKIMPRIIVLSNVTSSNIRLEENELSLILADFLQFWIVETSLYSSDQSPMMRRIRQDVPEWNSPKEMAPYVTFMTGTMYLPFEHILDWASHYTLRRMISFAQSEESNWKNLQNTTFAIELNKESFIMRENKKKESEPKDTEDNRKSSPPLKLQPEKLRMSDRIEEIPSKWQRTFRYAVEHAQNEALSKVNELNQSARKSLDEKYNSLLNKLSEVFEQLPREIKRFSLNPLIEKLEQETQTMESRLEELKLERIVVNDIEKKINEIAKESIEKLNDLARKDKRDVSAFRSLTAVVLILFFALILTQRGSLFSFLFGTVVLLLYLQSALNYFNSINREYMEIRSKTENSLRRAISDYINGYENSVKTRLLLKIGNTYLSRLSKIKSRVMELVDKFSNFMVSVMPGKPPYSPSHIPVIDEENSYAEFLDSQRVVLDEVAEDNFKDFLETVKRFVVEDINWDWNALKKEVRRKLRRRIGDAQELFSKAFDFASEKIESVIVQRLRNRVVNLTPLQLSFSTNYELWGLIPNDEPKFTSVISDMWGVSGQNMLVNKSNRLRLAAIMLVKLVWDIPISAFSGGKENEKQ